MKKVLAAGALTVALLAGASESYAQSNIIGNGLAGAGVGAAIGAIAGGGRGAATGALIGGTVAATGTAMSEARPYPNRAYPYRHYVAHGGCHWVPGHHTRFGEWRPGHCANY